MSAQAPPRAAPSAERVAATPKKTEPVAASPSAPPAAAAAVAGAAEEAHPLQAALPVVLQTNLPDETLFPHLPILKSAVEFWTHIFGTYSENETVVHSTDDLKKVFMVLDFRDQAQTLDAASLSALKSREEAQAKRDVEDLLRSVDKLQATPDQMSADERRIYNLYSDSRDPHRFIAAIDTIRTQRGLHERTQHAVAVSGRYMPQMESIFGSYNLPKLITRLPLMESSFNLAAYSKAGAAGVWQFIPSSARIYMRLNNVVDDRRDPWTSTDAAARHLKDDYDTLRDWPLALTAYNYGRGGLVRALADVNGTTLVDLIQRYDNRRFGFASRNYYAEFLAVADVERDWRKHFGDMERDAPVPFDLVETRDYVKFDTLRRISGADSETFRTLNPAYRDEVLDGKLYVPPANIIRVPKGMGEHFRVAYSGLGNSELFDRQRQMFELHRMLRGESLGKLAERYGISTQAILAANGLRNSRRVRSGQTIRIPTLSDPAPNFVAEEPEPARPLKVSTRPTSRETAKVVEIKTHHVRSGQTLGSIAERYQTTVALIRKLNHLASNEVQAGMTLKIPD